MMRFASGRRAAPGNPATAEGECVGSEPRHRAALTERRYAAIALEGDIAALAIARSSAPMKKTGDNDRLARGTAARFAWRQPAESVKIAELVQRTKISRWWSARGRAAPRPAL